MPLTFAELKERKELEEALQLKEREERRGQIYSEWLEAMKELAQYTAREKCLAYVCTMMFEDEILSEEGKYAYRRLLTYENCYAHDLPYFLRRFHDEERKLQMREVYHLHRCFSNQTNILMNRSIGNYLDCSRSSYSLLTEYFLTKQLLNLQINATEYDLLRRQAARIEERRATYQHRRDAHDILMKFEEVFNEYMPRIWESYDKTEEAGEFTSFPYA
jgi:hypothetical protein